MVDECCHKEWTIDELLWRKHLSRWSRDCWRRPGKASSSIQTRLRISTINSARRRSVSLYVQVKLVKCFAQVSRTTQTTAQTTSCFARVGMGVIRHRDLEQFDLAPVWRFEVSLVLPGTVLGDPGAASRDEGIFMGESLQQERESPWAGNLADPVPEAFQFPSSDWPEKYFSGQSAKRTSRATLMSS